MGCLPRPKPNPPALIRRHPGRAGKRTGHQAASSPSNRPRPAPTSNLRPSLGNSPSGDSSLERLRVKLLGDKLLRDKLLRDRLLVGRTRSRQPRPRPSSIPPLTRKPRRPPGHPRLGFSRIPHRTSTPTSFQILPPSRIRRCHRLTDNPPHTPAPIRASSRIRPSSPTLGSSLIRDKSHSPNRTEIR